MLALATVIVLFASVDNPVLSPPVTALLALNCVLAGAMIVFASGSIRLVLYVNIEVLDKEPTLKLSPVHVQANLRTAVTRVSNAYPKPQFIILKLIYPRAESVSTIVCTSNCKSDLDVLSVNKIFPAS